MYTPDYLFNDTVPADDPNFDFLAWLGHHGPNVTFPAIHAVQDALREKGVKKFAATGYCFGGLYTLLLSQKNEIKVGFSEYYSNVYLREWTGGNNRTSLTLASSRGHSGSPEQQPRSLPSPYRRA